MSKILRSLIAERSSASMQMYKQISEQLKRLDKRVKDMAVKQQQSDHPTDEFATVRSRLNELLQNLGESLDSVAEQSDGEYEAAKRRVSKIKKGATVSYTDYSGKTHTGTYGGMRNHSGRSYAKIEVSGKGLAMVPVTDVR
jgi:CRP-like cAMP-binding protein